jgi:hypothetical protein
MSSILVNSISPYSGNSVSFTNNANVAGSFSAVTYLNLPSSTFTGGTVNGLTATTISATTYQNLPSSTFTGGTVNGLTATTISATTYLNLPSNTFTGGTVNGLTATTISATSLTVTNIPNTNISDALYTVSYGLNASGTSIATGSICGYGVNVFTGVTGSNRATKLPQPVTGKSVKIINLSNNTLYVFPSNTGGTINNLSVDTPVIVPPDKKLYEFICVVNPLPGAWVWSAPSTNQYDSGEILLPTIYASGTSASQQQGIVVVDSTHFGVSKSNFGTTSWSYDGKHNPLIISGSSPSIITFLAFKPSSPWLSVNKIKIYTNIADCALSGTTGGSSYSIMGGWGLNYYATGTTSNGSTTWEAGDFIGDGIGYGGTLEQGAVSEKISGTPLISGNSVQENIGDPGTYYGEKELNFGQYASSNVTSIVGDYYLGEVLYPNDSPSGLQNIYTEQWSSFYISLQIKPMIYENWAQLSGIKVRFFIEYY